MVKVRHGTEACCCSPYARPHDCPGPDW